jgi:monoamine oxidase
VSTEIDVIIIGAGAAGLSAAKELMKQGLSYTVVEGSHRIGGRAYSEEIAPGVWFDLGCSYLHQGEVNPFGPIADELGVVIGREHGDIFAEGKLLFYHNGAQLSDADQQACMQYEQQCYDAISACVKRGEDSSIADLINLESPYAPPFMNGMAGLTSVDVDQCSVADLSDSGHGSDIPVLNGYGNLVARWAEGIPVSLNTKVESIDWSGKGVSVETNKGTIKARTVLSTVSNGILAANHIRFNPGLPDWKIDAINGLPTGTLNKTCLLFDKDIFGPDGRGFYHNWADGGEGSGIEASVMGQNLAIVFTGGRHTVWLEKQGQQAGHDFAVDQVAAVFGNDIRKSVSKSIITAWSTEPWTLGSYSCALPGQAHQRKELARSIDDRVFFAGEATINQHQATCHGAYLSGIRAAQEIKATLG